MDFSACRVVCLGDIMLDRFIYGQVNRISPEAPVPVVRMAQTNVMLGGVGNVARNIASLGGQAVVIGLIGEDRAGEDLERLLTASPGVTSACIRTSSRPTICKTRVIATHQHVVRLDEEVNGAVDDAIEQQALSVLESAIPDANVLVLSDYAKGLLTPRVVQGAIALARRFSVPVLVDPKQKDFAYYRGATVIKPNGSELEAASGRPVQTDEDAELAARLLLARAEASAILVTRSERGMMLVQAEGETVAVPARAREVFDVSGAGDTVIAVLALAYGAGASLSQAVRVANAAAGVVVGKLGTATLDRNELEQALNEDRLAEIPLGEKFVALSQAADVVQAWRRQGLVVGFTNGCFDILHRGHVSILKRAREHCDRLVVALNTDASVSRLKGRERPINALEDRVAVIEALQAVDLVVSFDDDTPYEVIRKLKPGMLFKGADYKPDQVVGADLVEADGGQVILLPLEEGRSTTRIIEKVRRQEQEEMA